MVASGFFSLSSQILFYWLGGVASSRDARANQSFTEKAIVLCVLPSLF